MLNVDYVVTGSLHRRARSTDHTVELVETRTARIVWAEIFNQTVDDTLIALDEIGKQDRRVDRP